jgi:hypothetical protein
MRDFRFEGGTGDRQKITAAVPLESYLVQYHDADGKQQVRIAFIVPGTDTGLVGQHQISGTQVFAPMSKWFLNQLKEKVGPKDGVESV